MPSVERCRTIDAPPARVYEAFVDLSRWLEWNPHLRTVTPLSEGPLAPGFRARIALKLNPLPSTWKVTEVNPGHSFAWVSTSVPGVRLVFDHVAESAEGGALATLRIDFQGPLGFLAGLAGPFYARNLDHSLAALKSLLEGEPSAAPEPEQPPAEEPAAEAPAEEGGGPGEEAETEATA